MLRLAIILASLGFLWLLISNIQSTRSALFTDFYFSPSTGLVSTDSERTPIRSGDIIRQINGLPVEASTFPQGHFQTLGQPVTISYESDGREKTVELLLVPIQETGVLQGASGVWAVALVFWFAGCFIAVTYLPQGQRDGLLFFLMMQSTAALLTAGTAAVHNRAYAISSIFMDTAPFLTVAFHTTFPKTRLRGRFVTLLLWVTGVLCAVTIITISIPAIASAFFGLTLPRWSLGAASFSLSYLIGWGGTAWLLFIAFRTTTNAISRKQIRIVLYCGLLALLPTIILSVIPSILLGDTVVNFEYTLLFTSMIPIGYVYAIRRYQFIQVERTVSRTATIGIVLTIVASLYAMILNVLQQSDLFVDLDQNRVQIVAALLVAAGFEPLRRWLQKRFDQLLYGGWYDFRSVVSDVFASLKSAESTKQSLTNSLVGTLRESLKVRWVGLLLLQDGMLVPATVEAEPELSKWFEQLTLTEDDEIVRMLKAHQQPMQIYDVYAALNLEHGSERTAHIWHNEYIQLLAPMVADELVGMLVMGIKSGGDVFSAEDIGSIEVVARQTALALENADLAADLILKTEESARFQRKASVARDQERQRVAREIHDQVVQALVGLKYQLAEIQAGLDLSPDNISLNREAYELQQQCGELIQISRGICHDLRPAVLDLGLLPGIRSVVDQFTQQTGIVVSFSVLGTPPRNVNEELTMCVVRCTQEALVNIRKHAQATQVNCTLTIQQSTLQLCIQDNGIGMTLPARLGHLMDEGHYGMVGMRERVELLEGMFEVVSRPNEGTVIDIHLPLTSAESVLMGA